MSEPGEIQFGCIGCGTMNPVGAEACAGCGHRFAGGEAAPVAGPSVRPKPRPVPSDNPYEPPSSPIAPPGTFRIGTALVLIALIAVCLGMLRANIALGVAAIVLLIPAGVRTPAVAGLRRLAGRPMSMGEQVATFLMTVVATWGIAISAVIAFFATCFPTGLATGSIEIALSLGATAAIACAAWLTRVFLGIGRKRAAKEREIRYH